MAHKDLRARAAYKKAYREAHPEHTKSLMRAWFNKHKLRIGAERRERMILTGKPRAGYFYILRFDKYIKIGYATNWKAREHTYNWASPFRMERLRMDWVVDANIKELLVRETLQGYKHQGMDWFVNVPPELLDVAVRCA